MRRREVAGKAREEGTEYFLPSKTEQQADQADLASRVVDEMGVELHQNTGEWIGYPRM